MRIKCRAVAVLAVVAIAQARAETHPSHSIRTTAVSPPVVASDVIWCAIAVGLQNLVRQPVMVESRSGVAGLLGIAESDAMARGSHLQKKPPHNPLNEVNPTSLVSRSADVEKVDLVARKHLQSSFQVWSNYVSR